MLAKFHPTLLTAAILAAPLLAQPPEKPKPVEPIAKFTGHVSPVLDLIFIDEGESIVSASSKDVRFWRIKGEKDKSKIMLEDAAAIVRLSPDGNFVATAQFENPRKRAVVVVSTLSGEETLAINPHADVTERTAFGGLVGAVAFSPDGERLVTAGRSGLIGGRHGLPGGVVKVWDAATGKMLLHIAGPRRGVSTSAFIGTVIFSADGRYVAAGTDGAGGELPEAGEIWVWEWEDGSPLTTIVVRDKVDQGDFFSSVVSLAMSPDNKMIAGSFGPRPSRRDGLMVRRGKPTALRIWELPSGRLLHTLLADSKPILGLAFSPDGKRLASAGTDKVVRIWDTSTGKEVRKFAFESDAISAVAFSPDGKRIAAGGASANGGEVRIWSLADE